MSTVRNSGKTLLDAVRETVQLADTAFCKHDLKAAAQVAPREQVVDELKDALRTRHIPRLQSFGIDDYFEKIKSSLLSMQETRATVRE